MKKKILERLQEITDIADMPDKEFIEYYTAKYPNCNPDISRYVQAAKLGHIIGLIEMLKIKVECDTL